MRRALSVVALVAVSVLLVGCCCDPCRPRCSPCGPAPHEGDLAWLGGVPMPTPEAGGQTIVLDGGGLLA